MANEYDLQANGKNGTGNTTRVGALGGFSDDAVWLVDATGTQQGGQVPPPPTPRAIVGLADNAAAVSGQSGTDVGVAGSSSEYIGILGAGAFGVQATGRRLKSGTGVLAEGFEGANGVVGLSFFDTGADRLSPAAGVIGASNGVSTRGAPEDVAGAGVVGLSMQSVPVLFDTGLPPLPDPNATPDGTGTGVWGASGSGIGVHGQSTSGIGGVFESVAGTGASMASLVGAQARLVPSSTPIEETVLMQVGQVGDLYLFSVSQEVGTSGTYDTNTVLWLCVAPASPDADAMWSQVSLGDTIGG